MKVFKFGGASVKDAASVKNVREILSHYNGERLCVVLSAMGKTTNALEAVADAWIKQDMAAITLLNEIETFHMDISKELNGAGSKQLKLIIREIRQLLQSAPPALYDAAYDLVVSNGELMSTAIVSDYLNLNGLTNQELDARKVLITNEAYRNARVSWEETSGKIRAAFDESNPEQFAPVTVTQGFIGSSTNGHPVTLGREGSDFSAAIFAYALDAGEMIIWKDVPGVLNADPRHFDDTVLLDRISYRDAIELAYFGASVIHPKTIQPLQNKNIPLYVKSFEKPEEKGTLIHSFEDQPLNTPCYIVKKEQVLVSVSPNDFSFIAEDGLHTIFGLLSHMGIRINLMQNSAISFSICIDDHPDKLNRLFKALSGDFRVKYNRGLELITIRYYNKKITDKIVNKRPVLLEQKSRLTVQLVVESQKSK
ncbi:MULTISPECIES: aspartate kinase [Lentimicrobium]|jgi:aspartate kinase|uniref:Aspartokinase n=2 Tax=Lentimicrobium TaxID=1840214 RepID=A0A0S7C0L9_9BACT|nr:MULTISPECIES: aspartate kinase [Lentimicrobium]GAP42175.1 aspartate kinase [Lentimicrobium saccharophilum]HOP12352.1 aspartate kinase [Lentimicrobium sp.]HPR24715.1 aspartate kinase [Lentimicrobium sp.]